MTLYEAVDDFFQQNIEGRREFHYEEVAVAITMHNNEYVNKSPDEIKNTIRDYLYRSATRTVQGRRVENMEGKYQRVSNGKGGKKNGVYKLRRRRINPEPRPVPNPIIPRQTPESSDKNYIGSAGEMAVCSELLFREYNVSQMSVDDGVDVVAIKNGKTFYIQVKTPQVVSNRFSVTIRTNSFERYNSNDCYYIIVARAKENKYLLFTADDIKRMISNGVISKSERQISICFSQSDGHIFIKNENVDFALNSFERIV